MNAGLMESVEGARQEVKKFEARMKQLEEERTELLQARDNALEAETRRAHELAESLENAVQEANLAKQAGSLARVEADARRQDRELVLDRIGVALRSIDRATGPNEIFDALLEPLAHDFAKAAVFRRRRRLDGVARTRSCRDERHYQAGHPTHGRLAAGARRLHPCARPGDCQRRRPADRLVGSPVAGAVALPIHAGDRIIAVAYAEDTEETSSHNIGRKITEMLIKHAALRLTTKGKASPQSAAATTANPGKEDVQYTGEERAEHVVYSPARQARRLKMREGIDVTLDGAASALVDMSSIGAQVLSSVALRPNRVVKMSLRGDESALSCKVRVMWARFEQPQGKAAAQYRVGVKFTDLEPKAADEFMARHGIAETKSDRLQDSA